MESLDKKIKVRCSPTDPNTVPPGQKLPEEVIEMIISKIEFPAIFKARCLSKHWLSRLSRESAVSRTFQKQVASVSRSWSTYYPAFVTHGGGLNFYIVGHNNITGGLFKMKINSVGSPLSMFIHEILLPYPVAGTRNCNPELSSLNPGSRPIATMFGGALICFIYRSGTTSPLRNRPKQIFVANVLTGCYRFLPPSPPLQPPSGVILGRWRGERRVFQVGTETHSTFKLVLASVCQGTQKIDADESNEGPGVLGYCLRIQYYESGTTRSTERWSDKYTFLDFITNPEDLKLHMEACSTILNSCVYILFFVEHKIDEDELFDDNYDEEFHNTQHSLKLLQYNVETSEIRQHTIDVNNMLLSIYSCCKDPYNKLNPVECNEILGSSVQICGSDILVLLATADEVTLEPEHLKYKAYALNIHHFLLKWDPETDDLEVLEESQGPPNPEFLRDIDLDEMRLKGSETTKFSSDENYAYISFRVSDTWTVIYSYHVATKTWTNLRCPRELSEQFELSKVVSFTTFAPGLRTFKL